MQGFTIVIVIVLAEGSKNHPCITKIDLWGVDTCADWKELGFCEHTKGESTTTFDWIDNVRSNCPNKCGNVCTEYPTISPSFQPTGSPSYSPSIVPTNSPSRAPTTLKEQCRTGVFAGHCNNFAKGVHSQADIVLFCRVFNITCPRECGRCPTPIPTALPSGAPSRSPSSSPSESPTTLSPTTTPAPSMQPTLLCATVQDIAPDCASNISNIYDVCLATNEEARFVQSKCRRTCNTECQGYAPLISSSAPTVSPTTLCTGFENKTLCNYLGQKVISRCEEEFWSHFCPYSCGICNNRSRPCDGSDFETEIQNKMFCEPFKTVKQNVHNNATLFNALCGVDKQKKTTLRHRCPVSCRECTTNAPTVVPTGSPTHRTEPCKNCDFEQVNTSLGLAFGWSVGGSSNSGVGEVVVAEKGEGLGVNVTGNEGSRFLAMRGEGYGVEQSILTIPGNIYTLNFLAKAPLKLPTSDISCACLKASVCNGPCAKSNLDVTSSYVYADCPSIHSPDGARDSKQLSRYHAFRSHSMLFTAYENSVIRFESCDNSRNSNSAGSWVFLDAVGFSLATLRPTQSPSITVFTPPSASASENEGTASVWWIWVLIAVVMLLVALLLFYLGGWVSGDTKEVHHHSFGEAAQDGGIHKGWLTLGSDNDGQQNSPYHQQILESTTDARGGNDSTFGGSIFMGSEVDSAGVVVMESYSPELTPEQVAQILFRFYMRHNPGHKTLDELRQVALPLTSDYPKLGRLLQHLEEVYGEHPLEAVVYNVTDIAQILNKYYDRYRPGYKGFQEWEAVAEKYSREGAKLERLFQQLEKQYDEHPLAMGSALKKERAEVELWAEEVADIDTQKEAQEDLAAIKIQNEFRSHNRKRRKEAQEELAARKIQTEFRNHNMKRHRAAKEIQSVFRGHADRKRVRGVKAREEKQRKTREQMGPGISGGVSPHLHGFIVGEHVEYNGHMARVVEVDYNSLVIYIQDFGKKSVGVNDPLLRHVELQTDVTVDRGKRSSFETPHEPAVGPDGLTYFTIKRPLRPVHDTSHDIKGTEAVTSVVKVVKAGGEPLQHNISDEFSIAKPPRRSDPDVGWSDGFSSNF